MTKKPFTAKQEQYLAFIFYHTKIHGFAPAESDTQNYFRVSPPSVHQMVLTLEANGFIERVPGHGRSIRLNDHEHLRTDPMMSVLADKADLERPLAGKSTLNRLELGGEAGEVDPYKKVHYDTEAIDALLVSLFLEARGETPLEIVIDLDATHLPCMAIRSSASFTASTTITAICLCTS